MNNNQKKSIMKTSDPAVLAKPLRALDVRVKPGDDPDLTVAKKLTNPRVSAGITVQEFQPLLKQYDINQVIVAINDEVRSVLKGDMSRPVLTKTPSKASRKVTKQVYGGGKGVDLPSPSPGM